MCPNAALGPLVASRCGECAWVCSALAADAPSDLRIYEAPLTRSPLGLPPAPRHPSRPPRAAATEARPSDLMHDAGIIVRMEGQPLLELAQGLRAVPLLTPETHRVPFAMALRIIEPGTAPAQVGHAAAPARGRA